MGDGLAAGGRGRVLVGHLNLKRRHFAGLAVDQEPAAEHALVKVRRALPRTGPPGRLLTDAGTAEDFHVLRIDLRGRLKAVQLHHIVAVAVNGDVALGHRAGYRIICFHNGSVQHDFSLLYSTITFM